MYLHGSVAMGCYNEGESDIDILVVIKESLAEESKKKIVQDILRMEKLKLEISILLEQELIDFTYPTPFELHYSEFHKERYMVDPNYLCAEGFDPDLAAHLVVTYERGICLYGKPIQDVFGPINHKYYVESILYDIENAVEKISEAPVYYTLNLCRVLLYLREGIVSSKREGGEWGAKVLPDLYKELISHCVSLYSGKNLDVNWDCSLLREFAKYASEKIRCLTLQSFPVSGTMRG